MLQLMLLLAFIPDLRRAGDGARTRDIKLGRLALYQLSYSRETLPLSLAADHKPGAWWGKDSNLRRLAPSDLQSDPVGHLGTPPDRLAPALRERRSTAELTARIELATARLQIGCSAN